MWNTLNGTTTVTEIAQTYDEIERLTSTAMGNNIVSTGFTYDIQNRLRMINNPSSLGTKPFAMELQYNAPNVSGATAQYSGNISAVRWRHNGGREQSYMVIVPSSALDLMNLGTMGGLVSRAKNSETDNNKK